MNKILGCVPSTIDGTEYIYENESKPIPSAYSYKKFMPKVLNQGSKPICVPCSVSAYLNWRENLKTGKKTDNKVCYDEIYASKTTNGEGMTFKEAFSYLRHHGVMSELGNLKIGTYAMVRSILMLKQALVVNGPCLGALPVYNETKEFWNNRYGDQLMGYHAISIVGYDEEGFIIRNSWGTSFADGGYTKIKNEDFNKLIEAWTIVS